MSVIFVHRVAIRRRHFLVSALLPYCYILFLAVGMLLVTIVASVLQALGQESVELFGRSWSLGGMSGVLLYLLGFGGEVFLLTSVYLVMPVGRLSLRHALIGAVTAAILWEITRHVLVWYFATLSQVAVVYGSLTTAIVVLLSLELGATFFCSAPRSYLNTSVSAKSIRRYRQRNCAPTRGTPKGRSIYQRIKGPSLLVWSPIGRKSANTAVLSVGRAGRLRRV